MRALILLLAYVFLSQSFASEIQVKDLLDLNHRPSMHEFVEKLDPMPKENPFNKMVEDYFATRLDFMAQFIVELEFAYPNATWALLGRDSSLSADILEAFYMHRKQEGRVVRLNASRPSFVNYPQDQIGLLYTAGLTTQSGFPLKKFVILDASNYQESSQIKSLLSAVYTNIAFEARHAFLPFVNAVN